MSPRPYMARHRGSQGHGPRATGTFPSPGNAGFGNSCLFPRIDGTNATLLT